METLKEYLDLLTCIYIISTTTSIIKYMVKTKEIMREWMKEDRDKYIRGYIVITVMVSLIPIVNTLIAYIWVRKMIKEF